ncbi:LuxR C-terminal-related transcriptional regulator [Nonomuraea sp. NPDC050310]|uniref:LuxR C-terminal-related transcriptional regulator n=1 Tax=Nonomuraea sp. NPDC050310 TaxID=3154935 RepID=UPI003402A84C
MGPLTMKNVPAETTSFVGRAADLDAVRDLLANARLVTLVGPGGVGKTRLAVRVARAVEAAFPDGVCLVELSSLEDPGLLATTVAAALDLPERPSVPAIELLAGHLRDRRFLLLLDTCEHLVDACAALAEVLLSNAPGLHVLATSRRPLDIPAEHTRAIAPLPVPEPGAPWPPDPGGALSLFADRAAAAALGFTVTEDNREEVGALCRRLDGIPLAIELAVVRLRALPLEAILARLDDRFQLLTGGSKTVIPRHQTLETTIGWSHDLCSPAERLLWARLSVFAGEFDLDAAEKICAFGELSAEAVLTTLISLVDQSVVQRVEGAPGARFRLLDTIRFYGAGRLAASGESEILRARHRDHYLAMTRAFDAGWLGPDQLSWLEWARHERPNIRVALEFCLSTPEQAPLGLELAGKLAGLWLCGLLAEGRHWLHRALELAGEPTTDRVRGLWLMVWLMDVGGVRGDTNRLLREGEELADRIGDENGALWCSVFRLHTQFFEATVAPDLAGFLAVRHRLAELGDRLAVIFTSLVLGWMHTAMGDPAQAVEACDEALAANADPEECWARSWALWVKSMALWAQGEHGHSARCLREAVLLKHRLGDVMGFAQCLEGLGWAAAERREHDRAARLLGAADTLWQRVSNEPQFGLRLLQEFHDKSVQVVQNGLGPHGYAAARQRGGALDVEQALALALDEPVEPGEDRRHLSPRERQVAELVADGLTNREIGERLDISKRTVDAHLEHILAKLGLVSRTQISKLTMRP